MAWSRYNTLWHSTQSGYFLYNTLSNSLLELDEEYYQLLELIRNNGGNAATTIDRDFSSLLYEKMILDEGDGETQKLFALHNLRQTICMDTSRLGLTICPTLQCNFRCPYCFEEVWKQFTPMSAETQKRLLTFIMNYKNIRHLSITWYGGEPLLAFDVIVQLTEKFKALPLEFEGACMVTNGYLLNRERIDKLNDLNINSIKITLDGPREVHDSRRLLADGSPTFQVILDNIDTLMNSGYRGICTVRVNIDKHNHERYFELREALLHRFRGKKLTVYAGRISTSMNHSYDHGCNLNLKEWSEFTLDKAHNSTLLSTGELYPANNLKSICVATTQHGFVVGPEGELYKCWEDTGKPEMVTGNIHEKNPVTNPELQELYLSGSDPYIDPVCLECKVLPLCGGGCPSKRLRAKQFGEKGVEFCSPFKVNIITSLERYIESFRTMEICTAVLTPGVEKNDNRGYRVISPEKNS